MPVAMVRLLQGGLAQQPTQLGRRPYLAWVWPGGLVGGAEGDLGTAQCLHRERGGHARGLCQSVGGGKEQGADSAHHLRAVEQRQPLLWLQHHWLQVRLRQCLCGRHHATVEFHLAVPDDRQRQVGEGSEIA